MGGTLHRLQEQLKSGPARQKTLSYINSQQSLALKYVLKIFFFFKKMAPVEATK